MALYKVSNTKGSNGGTVEQKRHKLCGKDKLYKVIKQFIVAFVTYINYV